MIFSTSINHFNKNIHKKYNEIYDFNVNNYVEESQQKTEEKFVKFLIGSEEMVSNLAWSVLDNGNNYI